MGVLLEEPICGVALGFSFRSSEKQEDGTARSTKLNWEKKDPQKHCFWGLSAYLRGPPSSHFRS